METAEKVRIEQGVLDNIKNIYDPEIPVNIYDLGLIYEVNVDDEGEVVVLMTLTAPNCPAAGILPGQVQYAAKKVEGVKKARVQITFDPPWSHEKMSEAAKLELGFI